MVYIYKSSKNYYGGTNREIVYKIRLKALIQLYLLVFFPIVENTMGNFLHSSTDSKNYYGTIVKTTIRIFLKCFSITQPFPFIFNFKFTCIIIFPLIIKSIYYNLFKATLWFIFINFNKSAIN